MRYFAFFCIFFSISRNIFSCACISPLLNALNNWPHVASTSGDDGDSCRIYFLDYFLKLKERWCKRESVECNALKEWKLSIFNIVDKRIKFYSQNTNFLPPKPKSSFGHLKQGIQKFHRKYVLVPADKAANNVVVVCRLHYINTLKQELNGTKAYEETSIDEKSVVYRH